MKESMSSNESMRYKQMKESENKLGIIYDIKVRRKLQKIYTYLNEQYDVLLVMKMKVYFECCNKVLNECQ